MLRRPLEITLAAAIRVMDNALRSTLRDSILQRFEHQLRA
jgi:hypothetical protein